LLHLDLLPFLKDTVKIYILVEVLANQRVDESIHLLLVDETVGVTVGIVNAVILIQDVVCSTLVVGEKLTEHFLKELEEFVFVENTILVRVKSLPYLLNVHLNSALVSV
jgi:hypothetical protein